MSAVSARLSLEGADGLTLAADAYGDESAPVVFLLHGGGQTRHSWGATAALLAERGYRAITLDQRGHGESEWDKGRRYKQADFGRDVFALSQRFDKPFAVVGASLGGNSGLLACGDLGAKLSALVLVDIGPKIERTGVERIYEFMRAKPDGFASLDEVADLVAAYQPHRTRPKDISGLAKNLRQGADGRYKWHWDPAFLEEMFQPQPEIAARLENASKNLAMPVLLVRGKLSDLLSEENAKHFLELCPHAKYVDVAGAAHMVAGDQNDYFTDAVVAFLDSAIAR
jgi:pimeloyl-ACP methyl ester carboxylesterase